MHKDSNHAATGIIKEKTVEFDLYHEPIAHWQPTPAPVKFEPVYITFIPERATPAIFQPPRITPNA